MKLIVVVVCLALASVGTAVASTGADKKAWTESKAERLVLSGATVRLSAEDRQALEAELRSGAAIYRALALEAQLTGYIQDSNGYYQEAYAYSRALAKVQRGLAIDTADCMGSGTAADGRRFSTFQCNVVSETLEIPSGSVAGDGEPPVADPRNLGPIEVVLDVRVKGTSSFSYKAL